MLGFVLALPSSAQDMVQANKTVVTTYLDYVYNQMDLDRASALLADNVVFHDPIWDSRDIKGFVNNYRLLFDRVRDFKMTPYTIISEGDFVAVSYVWQGSKAPQEPRAAIEPLSGNAVEFFRVLDGKIAEIWRQYEQHDFSILGTSEDYRSMVSLPITTTDVFTVSTTQTSTVNANRQIVLNWMDAYNRGKLNLDLMQSNFLQHTCPCDGVGTVDLAAYAENFRQMKDAGTLKQMTPTSHNLGYMMVTEGNLTAVLYDTHESEFQSHPESVSIFRVQDGKIADLWEF
jgi:predicted SnoaL-like aldol condensation-catalyzing enzyme